MSPARPGRAALLALLLALAPALARAEGLGLEELRGLAESRSGLLAASRLEAARLEAAVAEARARGLPRLSLLTTGSWLANPPEGITVPAGGIAQSPMIIPSEPLVFVPDAEASYFKAAASLEQLLFSWGKVGLGVEAGNLGARAAAEEARGSLQILRREVGRARAGALLGREGLPLLREVEDLLAGALVDAERAFSEGAAARVEVLSARARLAEAAARRVGLEEALASSLEALAFYAGRRISLEELAGGLPARLPALEEAALLRSLLAGPELAAAAARSSQAALGEALARASLAGLPDFFLKADFEYAGQGLPGAAGWEESYDWALSLTLGGKVELWDSLASKSRLDQASLARRAAEAGRAELERSAPLRLRRALEAARGAEARLLAAEAGLELAREEARNAAAAFENELAARGEERGARARALGAELEALALRAGLEEALLELEALAGLSLPRAGP